jgi:hypothetical protein
MTVASFFRKYSVGCILNYVRLIITREISCIYIQLLLQLCTEVSQVTTQRTVAINKFWTSFFCHRKKITLNHALLKLSHMNDEIVKFYYNLSI